jgi:superfamily I DNA and/or RNA helicase
MILVGDPMQLQPVMSEAEQQVREAASAGVSRSFFAWIGERGLPEAATVFLHEQNRMHPAIGELVSSVFYAGRLTTGPNAPRGALTTELLPHAVTWIDTQALAGSQERRLGGVGSASLSNAAEARVVAALVEHLVRETPGEASIGVISAYAEQRRLLRGALRSRAWPAARQLEIDTIDAFEGREKDIIVLSLVRANQAGQVGFLREAPRLNVAVSRARRLLVIVGDSRTLRAGGLDRLFGAVQRVGGVVAADGLDALTGATP